MSLSSRINDLAVRAGTEIKSLWTALNGKASASHDHSGVYEPAFSKNTGFNKNFGTAAGTVCQGNDSRLSDNRTPSDSSVTVSKLASSFKNVSAMSDLNVDWSVAGIFTKTLASNSTLTFSNLQLNKIITLVVSGNYTLTLPTYCKIISGTYSGSVTNYIQLHCTNAGSGNEEVWLAISKQL